jgi:hypothetical protein
MSDRIHRYLDGELPREALSGGEQAHAAELESVLRAAAVHLRSAPAPDLVGRVMAALPHAAPAAAPRKRASGAARVWAWLWSPRPLTVSFRPAYAMLALAALALGVPHLPSDDVQPAAEPVALAHGAAPPVYVQFRLNTRGARRVELAGTFTGWKPGYELHETAPGVWTAVVPLRPGVHDYAFVVDGRWVSDPTAPQVDDSFGGTNSRISLLPPGDAA